MRIEDIINIQDDETYQLNHPNYTVIIFQNHWSPSIDEKM